jgi:hypothetical protein
VVTDRMLKRITIFSGTSSHPNLVTRRNNVSPDYIRTFVASFDQTNAD